MRAWSIYVLTDPRTDAPRYIGKTSISVAQRLRDHIAEARRTAGTWKLRWIRQLLSEGLRPGCETLEVGDTVGGDAAAERAWIAALRADGVKLVNLTDGGEGTPGWQPTPETRARISAATTGKRRTPEARARMSAAHKGCKRSPEALAKLSATLKAIGHEPPHGPMPPEVRAKIAATLKGRKHSAEFGEKIAASKRGKPMPEATKAKISAKLRGRKNTPEQCARKSAITTELWRSGRLHRGR